MNQRDLWERARHYCTDRIACWHAEYAALPDRGRAADGRQSTPQALATFPRYQVLEAILPGLEGLALDDSGDLVAAMVLVVNEAGGTLPWLAGNDIQGAAVADERARFVAQLRAGFPGITAAPLPWRRTLGTQEAADLWRQLAARWDIDRYSWPIRRDWLPEPPPDATAFDAVPFVEANVAAAARLALRSLGCRTVFRLGPDRDYCQEHTVEEFAPICDGEESYWCDMTLAWLVFASHENTVTFAGTALSALQEAWPAWNAHVYK